jgi:type VI secretion system protein ImpK
MRLSDQFIELLAYVSQLTKTAEGTQASFQQVRERVVQLLTRSERCVELGQVPREDFDMARFAVCAWVDEVLLSSAWEQKHLWLREQLQRVYFGTTDAGEEFFQRLNGLGLQQREVREVYYLCLALGFTGRFCEASDALQLEQLKNANLKLLSESPQGYPAIGARELFLEADCTDDCGSGSRKRFGALSLQAVLCLVGPVLLFGVLFLIYSFTLRSVGDDLLRSVAR